MKRICDWTYADYRREFKKGNLENKDSGMRWLDVSQLTRKQKFDYAKAQILYLRLSAIWKIRFDVLLCRIRMFKYLNEADQIRAKKHLNLSFKKDISILNKEIHLIEKRLPYKIVSEKQRRRFRKEGAKHVKNKIDTFRQS